jgi:hypothetical protein
MTRTIQQNIDYAKELLELMPEWRLGDKIYEHGFTLLHKDGPSIFFAFDYRGKVVTVSGNIPRDSTGQMPYVKEYCHINFSVNKGAAKTARDISVRLLPKYFEQYKELKEVCDNYDRAHQQKNDTKIKIENQTGLNFHKEGSGTVDFISEDCIEINVDSDGSFSFKVKNLPEKQMFKLLNAVVAEIEFKKSCVRV